MRSSRPSSTAIVIAKASSSRASSSRFPVTLPSSRGPRCYCRRTISMRSPPRRSRKSSAWLPDDPSLIGGALVPARFTCDWEWIDTLQGKLGAWYDAGQFGLPQEFPLTHITWCPDEARNLGVTRAYVDRAVPKAERIALRPHRSAGGRIRVGYLSSDFRNHATMHLMAGVFEHHDHERFEVFAYDYTAPDVPNTGSAFSMPSSTMSRFIS